MPTNQQLLEHFKVIEVEFQKISAHCDHEGDRGKVLDFQTMLEFVREGLEALDHNVNRKDNPMKVARWYLKI